MDFHPSIQSAKDLHKFHILFDQQSYFFLNTKQSGGEGGQF